MFNRLKRNVKNRQTILIPKGLPGHDDGMFIIKNIQNGYAVGVRRKYCEI